MLIVIFRLIIEKSKILHNIFLSEYTSRLPLYLYRTTFTRFLHSQLSTFSLTSPKKFTKHEAMYRNFVPGHVTVHLYGIYHTVCIEKQIRICKITISLNISKTSWLLLLLFRLKAIENQFLRMVKMILAMKAIREKLKLHEKLMEFYYLWM